MAQKGDFAVVWSFAIASDEETRLSSPADRSISLATAIVKKLVDAGHIALFAGGWVRDFLLKHPSDDIDIATSASVEQVQALFPKTIPVGVAFGIVIVVEDDHQFEVATFRKESEYVDGRRPQRIEPATPEEDALRRDFTINGMFWDPLSDCLFDYVQGERDLKLGLIRAIGNPHERIFEDRLRMMRAVRYSTRFHFPIEAATREAILAHASALLPSVAMERVWQEFKKLSQFEHFDRGLLSLYDLGLLTTIFPDLKSCSQAEITSRISYLDAFPPSAPTIAELLELFPSYSLEQLLQLCDYLKLSRHEKDLVGFLHHARKLLEMPTQWAATLEPIEWAHFYSHTHSELSLHIHAAHLSAPERSSFLHNHETRRLSLMPAITRIQTQRPVVNAELLLTEGILPGKKMGLLLKEAERIAVNNNLDNAQKVLEQLKKSSFWS